MDWIKQCVDKILPLILGILFTSVKSSFLKSEKYILAHTLKRQEMDKLQGENRRIFFHFCLRLKIKK